MLQALVGRNAIKYKDQERVVAMGLPEEEEKQQGGVAKRRPNLDQEGASAATSGVVSAPRAATKQQAEDAGAQLIEADADEEVDEVEEVDEEEEYDEVEVEGAEDADVAAAASSSSAGSASAAFSDDRTIDADEVPVDLDPRGRVAPPLPPQASWELSPPPPPSQRAMPLSNLRPQFKFYTLLPDASAAEADSQSRNAASPVALPAADDAEKRFGLTVLIKTQNMGALNMVGRLLEFAWDSAPGTRLRRICSCLFLLLLLFFLQLRASIEDMNSVNTARGLRQFHAREFAVGTCASCVFGPFCRLTFALRFCCVLCFQLLFTCLTLLPAI